MKFMLITEKIIIIKNEINVIMICFVTILFSIPPAIDNIDRRLININIAIKITNDFIKNKFFLTKYFELIIDYYHLGIFFLPDRQQLMHQ